MTLQRKISVRKIMQVFTTMVVTLACVAAMAGAARVEDSKLLKKISVQIRNSRKYHFIEQTEVMNEAMAGKNVNIMQTPLGKLDLASMERVLRADPWIADAQVYVDNNDVLNINVTQRVPEVRLFFRNGGCCYMDSTLFLVPLSPNFVYYTTVVTNMQDLKNDSLSKAIKAQLKYLVRTIQADTFWNAQVSQIILDSVMSFEFIPILGNQRVILGDTTRLREKLENLFAFYCNTLNRIGWDKYDVLDLRFRNQVVASPAIPYHGPEDKAIAGMNWVNSMIETAASKDDADTTTAFDDHTASDTTLKKPVATTGTANKKVRVEKVREIARDKGNGKKIYHGETAAQKDKKLKKVKNQ